MVTQQKVEKLICHEKSARLLGSYAEADAFAETIERLVAERGTGRSHRGAGLPARAATDPAGSALQPVSAEEAGIGSRKSRQEWVERIAYACAAAFGCELLLQARSNTVLFRGSVPARQAAAGLYARLVSHASSICEQEFSSWKLRRRATPSRAGAAHSRRWKQSFLLGFSLGACERFVCGQQCQRKCMHAEGLVRIGGAVCPSGVMAARAIGGTEILYDALYRGRDHAAVLQLALEQAA